MGAQDTQQVMLIRQHKQQTSRVQARTCLVPLLYCTLMCYTIIYYAILYHTIL